MHDLQTSTLWTMTLARPQVVRSCRRVAQELQQGQPFCLWLNGEVGSGKTSWVAEFLHYLGLERSLAVASPTFTYAREYEIGGELYNHCDLYRIESIAAWRGLGIEARDYRGMLIEWATPTNCDAVPTHRLHIELHATAARRRYVFCRQA